MAGKQKTKTPTPITPDTVVPYTSGLTYGQACHTRRNYGGYIKKGTLLAREGAWQNKAVVAYVVYGGEVTCKYGPRHVYTIGICPLGKLYADGRMRPGKAEDIREVQVETMESQAGRYELGGWAIVECFDVKTRKAVIIGARHGDFVQRPNDQYLVLDADKGPVLGKAGQAAPA